MDRLAFAVTLFLVLDPFGNAPVFHSVLLAIALAVTGAWLVAAVILWFTPAILKRLGTKGSRALERLMGMLLILVAVQMFLDGVSTYQAAMSRSSRKRHWRAHIAAW